jgi:hypothetical protein
MAISATVVPGKVWSSSDKLDVTNLNAAAAPTVNIEGTVGTLALADDSVTNAKVKSDAAIAYSKLASLATGQVVVGNGGTPTVATMSGDATVSSAGAVTLAASNTNLTTLANVTSVGTLTSLAVTGDVTVDTDTLKVDSTNNRVGIGTTDPGTLLELEGSGSDLLTINSTSSYAGILFEESGASRFKILTNDGTSGLKFYDTLAAVERMRIDAAGNVGIGRAPTQKLDQYVPSGNNWHLISSGANELYMGYHTSDGQSIQSSGELAFHTGASFTKQMTIDAAGNVGIGTAVPVARIHVLDTSTHAAVRVEASAANKIAGVQLVNDAQEWQIRNDGANNGDNFIIRDLTAVTVPFVIEKSTGHVTPGADGTQDLGSSSLKWNDIYSANAHLTTSDREKKDNITDSDLGLDFVEKLRPVSFKWKDYSSERVVQEAVEAVPASERVVREATEAVPAVMQTVTDMVPETEDYEQEQAEAIEIDGKWVMKKTTVTRQRQLFDEVPLYDEEGEEIGKHQVPRLKRVVRDVEVSPAVEAVEEITESVEGTDAIEEVTETVEHTFTRPHYGLIAQEVEEALAGADCAALIKSPREDGGHDYGLRYSELLSPLIKAVQELSARVKELEA